MLEFWAPMSALGHSRPGPAGRRSSHDRYAPKATVGHQNAIGRDGPCVDGSELARRIFTSQAWSVQPCVRPVDAVHMTPGHNALRGSGPDRRPAFEAGINMPVLCQLAAPDGAAPRSANYVVSFLTYTSSFQYSLTSYFRTSSTHVVFTPRRGISRL
jgi:hypothetical protein